MPSREEYMRRPLEQRLARLARTPDELDEAFRTRRADVLARRPDASNWSATEIVCHLRDVEELFRIRFHTILALDDPKILTLSADPEDLEAWGIGGRLTLADWVATLASHDDNHVDQLRRALDGCP
jgi:hypothetical protein